MLGYMSDVRSFLPKIHYLWHMGSQTDKTIHELAKVLDMMVRHRETIDEVWMNIPLGSQAFEMFRSLPDTVKGEYDTPAEKACLICNMLEQMEETLTPRFCLKVRTYVATLDPENSENASQMRRLSDYIDDSISMEEWCRRYHRHLKFDPVERSAGMEDIVYEVERECARLLKDEPRCMGFCFAYWNARSRVLSGYGIRWRSPHEMNPGVIFD